MAEALGLKVAMGDDLPQAARVAILVPAYRGLCPEVQAAFRELETYSAEFCLTQRFEISKPIIHSARNALARLALNDAKNFTHLLWLDDDMLPEPDALVRLLKHEKDIVGGLYVMRRPPHKPIAYRLNEKREYADFPEVPAEGLIEVDACGTGIMLVNAKVMHLLAECFYNLDWECAFWKMPHEVYLREQGRRRKAMEPLWFRYLSNEHGQELGEDLSFCLNAKDAGYSIWVDCSLRVGHLGQRAFYREDWIKP
jgi:hypothetical protein